MKFHNILRYRYKITDESFFDMEDRLDELGEDGWELISVNTCPFDIDRRQLYFKRLVKPDLKRWRYHFFEVDFDGDDMLDEDSLDGWVHASIIVDPYNDDMRHVIMKRDRDIPEWTPLPK